MSLFDKDDAEGLDPATPEEVEWAFKQAHNGYTEDFIRRGILAAADEDQALRFVRYQQNGSGCGPSGGPGGVAYFCDYDRYGIHAFFGARSGEPMNGDFKKGMRYVGIPWHKVIRRVRDEAAGPTLF